MATLIAHLVIGERVSATVHRLRSSSRVYGAFLLGCVLVDANNYSDLERHQTHLTKLSTGEDRRAPRGSSASFLIRRDSLLLRRWDTLTEPERAFVAGYLCHLAADEVWLEVSRTLLRHLGLKAWDDLPVPPEVMLVTFNALSQGLFEDFPTIASALNRAAMPDVFAHVPREAFQGMWDVAQAYVLDGGGLASYLTLLEGQGKSRAEIQTVRQHGDRNGESARALVREAGGIERFIRPAVEWAVRVVPRLWGEETSGWRS